MIEKVEVKVGEKVFHLMELIPVNLEKVFIALYKNYEFDKEAAVKKVIELTLINKEETLTEEDLFYLGDYVSNLLDTYILDCREDVDDDIIGYYIQDGDVEYKHFIKKPSWTEVKALREFERGARDLGIDIDLYTFCKDILVKLRLDSVKDEDGSLLTSDIQFLTDVKLQVPIVCRLLTHIKAKKVEIKKK